MGVTDVVPTRDVVRPGADAQPLDDVRRDRVSDAILEYFAFLAWHWFLSAEALADCVTRAAEKQAERDRVRSGDDQPTLPFDGTYPNVAHGVVETA